MSEATQTQILRWENEPFTNAKKTIDSDHAYIHAGIFFETFLPLTLVTTATHTISFHTPVDKFVHYRMEKVACSGDKLTISLFEDATATSGSLLPAYNHNRGSTTTAETIVRSVPTVTATGTEIARSYIGGGENVAKKTMGSATSFPNEWILKKDTTYLVILTNGSAETNEIVISNIWYEEENGY